MAIRERHGIADAQCDSGGIVTGEQSVLVTDGIGRVVLTTSKSDPAGLTPEQADAIADMLRASAQRVRGAVEAVNE